MTCNRLVAPRFKPSSIIGEVLLSGFKSVYIQVPAKHKEPPVVVLDKRRWPVAQHDQLGWYLMLAYVLVFLVCIYLISAGEAFDVIVQGSALANLRFLNNKPSHSLVIHGVFAR